MPVIGSADDNRIDIISGHKFSKISNGCTAYKGTAFLFFGIFFFNRCCCIGKPLGMTITDGDYLYASLTEEPSKMTSILNAHADHADGDA